jgi:hypothetical protein
LVLHTFPESFQNDEALEFVARNWPLTDSFVVDREELIACVVLHRPTSR